MTNINTIADFPTTEPNVFTYNEFNTLIGLLNRLSGSTLTITKQIKLISD